MLWVLQITLASSAAVDESRRDILLSLAVVVVIAVVVGLIGRAYYKRVKEGATGADDQPLFTLADLRRLHREGQLTDDEFEVAKMKLISMLDGGAVSEDGDESITDLGDITAAQNSVDDDHGDEAADNDGLKHP